MGFKADTSFLRFLTMGAVGARKTADYLRQLGFQPIELERYCTSNKIWATKIKRLRVPDLLCVRTGLRVEVRAKSKLTIKMSDAPANPDRAWDAGLRDDDLVAFVACFDSEDGPIPAPYVNFFSVDALRRTTAASRLGPPKSASEGSERDREWPSVVPKRNGVVAEVGDGRLKVRMEGDGEPTRIQNYALNGKTPYVRNGDRFLAGATFLAGAPTTTAEVRIYLDRRYDPLAGLASNSMIDRYAAVKALPYRDDVRQQAIPRLEALVREEADRRVALEAAGSAAFLGSAIAETHIANVLANGPTELRMEAVFILTELRTKFAAEQLTALAANLAADSELRQAAIWGLGFAGHRRYEAVLPHIAVQDDNVALHAIGAFGPDTPRAIVAELARRLDRRSPRVASAASEALRLIGNAEVVASVADILLQGQPETLDWAIATLGRLDAPAVRARLNGTSAMSVIEPLLQLYGPDNWLAHGDRPVSLSFLLGQRLTT